MLAAAFAALVLAASQPSPTASEAPTPRERATLLCHYFKAAKEDFGACVLSMLRDNPERRAFGEAYSWAHSLIDREGWTVRTSVADKVNLSKDAAGPAPWSPRAWLRTENREEPAQDPHLSGVRLYEFDCVGQRMRNLQSTLYAGHNLQGEAKTVTADAPKWEYANPGSVEDIVMQDLCRSLTS